MDEIKTLEIRGARARLGYSQREMAERLGMSLSSYQCRESGAVEFTIDDIVKLAEVLGLNIGQINDFIFDGRLPVT